jgi:hypothetical protein
MLFAWRSSSPASRTRWRTGSIRSSSVRLALEELVDRLERERIGRQIVEAYRRMPETDEERALAEESLEEMLAEEPW